MLEPGAKRRINCVSVKKKSFCVSHECVMLRAVANRPVRAVVNRPVRAVVVRLVRAVDNRPLYAG